MKAGHPKVMTNLGHTLKKKKKKDLLLEKIWGRSGLFWVRLFPPCGQNMKTINTCFFILENTNLKIL